MCKRSLSGRFRGKGAILPGDAETDLTAHLDSLAPDADRRRTKNRECHEAIRINPRFPLHRAIWEAPWAAKGRSMKPSSTSEPPCAKAPTTCWRTTISASP